MTGPPGTTTPSTKKSTLETTASDMEAVERRKTEEFRGRFAPETGDDKVRTRTAPTVTTTGAEVAELLEAEESVTTTVREYVPGAVGVQVTEGVPEAATVPMDVPFTRKSAETIENPTVGVALALNVTPAGEDTVAKFAPNTGAVIETEGTAMAAGSRTNAATQAAAAGMRRRSVFMAGIARGLLRPGAGARLGAGRGDDRRVLEERVGRRALEVLLFRRAAGTHEVGGDEDQQIALLRALAL